METKLHGLDGYTEGKLLSCWPRRTGTNHLLSVKYKCSSVRLLRYLLHLNLHVFPFLKSSCLQPKRKRWQKSLSPPPDYSTAKNWNTAENVLSIYLILENSCNSSYSCYILSLSSPLVLVFPQDLVLFQLQKSNRTLGNPLQTKNPQRHQLDGSSPR